MDIIFPNIGIKIESLDRVAFSVFGFDIYWYGIFICVGALIGVCLCAKEAERTGQNKDVYMDSVLWLLLFSVAGARAYYLIFHNGSLSDFFAIREGGLAIYGGIIAGVITSFIYSKIKNIYFPKFADTVIMSLLCGQILGRWGNFFNREAFGKATNSLFAMCYKVSQVNGAKIVGNEVKYNLSTYPLTVIDGVNYIQVHPTFLYESLWNLCLLIFLMWYRKRKRFDGELTLFYFTGYGIGRFIIESLRTDQLLIFKIPVSMIVASLSAIVTVVIEVVMIKKIKKYEKNA
ncbi:MAG: prolipoprotein diacylglyceryl transferase [Lachnospirales bacterium]